ncbi:MAG: hypothetical protein U5R31_08245 [Acidimicrobiia bacterium]|nr:hypothetical protein [Acidimicrobiia bacterium]
MPDEVTAATGRQLGFWGEETEAAERVVRAAHPRSRGCWGPTPSGCRMAWRAVTRRAGAAGARGRRRPHRSPPCRGRALVRDPWPGALPAPPRPRSDREHPPVEVVDAAGAPVRVDGRW